MERLIILTPTEPAGTGNGLSMRADLFRRSAPADLDVQVVVVPVAGQLAGAVPRATRSIIVAPDLEKARLGIRSLIADAAWRERLARVATLPSLARAASPGLVDAVVQSLDRAGGTAVHVVRSYLAPLGLAVAERIGAAWSTLDLDEDDAALAAIVGDTGEADSYRRLLDTFGQAFDGLSMASDSEAAVIAARHGLVVDVIPNAVDLPGDPPRRAGHGRDVSLLFVGNLMYRPNIDAAHLLVETILPEIRRRLGDALRLQLVGLHAGGLETLADRNVEVTGFVRDLRHVYARADVVVVPLSVGGGTRIKLLEAFANQVPVVASPVGASGLRVAAGRHLLLAEDPGGFAAAVERLVRTPSLARRLVREAARLVRDEYSTDVVIPRVRHFFRQAADRARVGPNCRRGLDRPQRLA